jgi:hypothetical protein
MRAAKGDCFPLSIDETAELHLAPRVDSRHRAQLANYRALGIQGAIKTPKAESGPLECWNAPVHSETSRLSGRFLI